MNNSQKPKQKKNNINNNNNNNNNQQKRNRNPRRRRPRQLVAAVRDTHTITTQLQKSFKKMVVKSNPYLDSRLCCSYIVSPPSIPDGKSGRHVCYCAYGLSRIAQTNPSGGTFSFHVQLQPWFPILAAVTQTTTGLQIDSSSYPNIYGTPGYPVAGLCSPAIYGSAVGGQFSQIAPGSQQGYADPFAASSGRIVSATYRIMYTGPVQTCAGCIRTFDNHIQLQAGPDITYYGTATSSTGGTSMSLFNNTGSVVGSVSLDTPILTPDGSIAPAPVAGSVTLRPEQGAVIRLSHKTNDFKSQSFLSPLYGITCSQTAVPAQYNAYSSLFYVTGNATNTIGGGIALFDNDWQGVHVLFDNVNTDATFQIEACVCMELAIEPTGPMYSMQKTDTLRPNPKLIERAHQILQTEGHTLPAGEM